MKIVTRTSLIILSSIGFAVFTSVLRADPATQPATTQPASTQPTTAPVTINWDEAAKHVGETVTVTGPVKGTHVTSNGKSLVLNIGKDFPAPDRFSVMIAVDAKHPADESAYKDKTVTATGKIELYRKVPEVKVKAADVTSVPTPAQ